MDFLRPRDWAQALADKAERPEAVPVSGGTDVMVELNFGRSRPAALLDLTGVPDLTTWSVEDGWVRLGARVTYRQIVDSLTAELPALSAAARTVGSPQIRNRATVAGNLGAASPAGDSHPPLLAAGAVVEAESVRGTRRIPVEEFYLGPKKNALAPDELIKSIRVKAATGPQQFAKVGSRNAMVIAVCSFAVALHDDGTVGTGIGSAGPTPLRAYEAEEFLTGFERSTPLDENALERFGHLVAQAARPIDDLRGSADYRRHALAVMARRTLSWAWNGNRMEVAA